VTEDYLAPGPCSHTGPCSQSNPACTCAEESVHCVRSCRCDFGCQRRREGCRCVLAPVPWSSIQKSDTCSRRINKCPCRKKGWECDPTVCECDDLAFLDNPKTWNAEKARSLAPKADGKYYCQNSDVQRGLAAKIEIKRGKYGLGAFAVNWISSGRFIGEYIGELIPTHEDKREPLRNHVDLNYNFGYNRESNLDSARVGNETRYINHAKSKANAEAGTRLVFGEQRIGLWAKRGIRKGEEILFDYGDNYWKNKKKKT